MKTYTLEEARLMHSIGIRMRCINAKLPIFVNSKSIVMQDKDHICCEDMKGRPYAYIGINEHCNQWVIADDI